MQIKDATVTDLEAIILIMRKMHGESSTYSRYPLNLDKARYILQAVLEERAPTAFFKLAYDGDQLVGALFAEVVEDLWTDAKYASEHGLYVTPEARRNGIAAALLAQFDEWAEAQGAQRIDIRINAGIDDDIGASAFAAMGYERRGVFMGKDF